MLYVYLCMNKLKRQEKRNKEELVYQYQQEPK